MTNRLCDSIGVLSSERLGLAGLQQAIWSALKLKSEGHRVVLGVNRVLLDLVKNDNLFVSLIDNGVDVRLFTWESANKLKVIIPNAPLSNFPRNSELSLANDSKVAFHDISKILYVTRDQLTDFLFHRNVETEKCAIPIINFFENRSTQLSMISPAISIHLWRRRIIDLKFLSNPTEFCVCIDRGIHDREDLRAIMEEEMGKFCEELT